MSAPIAIDRVALSACGERYRRDQQGEAGIFGALLAEDDDAARKAVATLLIQRLLSRHPTDDELAGFEGLYVELSGLSGDVTRDWGVGTCLAIATSTEALFY